MKRKHCTARAVAMSAAIIAGGMGASAPATAQDPFVAQIQFMPYNFAPRGWTFCNGQLLSISQNTAVFALVGTTFGGDGRTTLGVPDMRGRSPLHPGRGPGLTDYRWGEKGGAETVTLALAQMPSHSHQLRGTNTNGDQSNPSGNTLARSGRDQTYSNAAPDTGLHAESIAPAGGGESHENMPPWLAVNCNFALTGIFPSRQ